MRQPLVRVRVSSPAPDKDAYSNYTYCVLSVRVRFHPPITG
nr:MAG TPA: hypothetical protein [Caudoviricetes sp.]